MPYDVIGLAVVVRVYIKVGHMTLRCGGCGQPHDFSPS